MSDPLRDAVQKLAAEKPELRAHLVPLLRKHAGSGGIFPDAIWVWRERTRLIMHAYGDVGKPNVDFPAKQLGNIVKQAERNYKSVMEGLYDRLKHEWPDLVFDVGIYKLRFSNKSPYRARFTMGFEMEVYSPTGGAVDGSQVEAFLELLDQHRLVERSHGKPSWV